MSFEFEARARVYDYAAEQEILLRYISGRRKKRLLSAGALMVVLVICMGLLLVEKRMTETIMQIFLMGFLFFGSQWFWYEFTNGNLKGLLKNLYRGRHPNMPSGDRILGLRLEGDAFQLINDTGIVTTWECSNLYSVQESEEIFDLCRGRFSKQYLALPKSALTQGTVDEFRNYLESRITSGKHVEYYTIPAKLQLKLKAMKKELFGVQD